MYGYLIIGSGLFGATFANLARKAGKNVLVIDKRPHIAGDSHIFGGMPAEYKYYDMDDVVERAMAVAKQELRV